LTHFSRFDAEQRRLSEFQTVRMVLPNDFRRHQFLESIHPRRVVQLEGTRLIVALRHFLAMNKREAQSLDELVPKFLATIPLDPFDGKPMRYRVVSKDEKILMRHTDGDDDGHQLVRAGQGLVWSIGEDRRDNHGKRQVRAQGFTQIAGEAADEEDDDGIDIVFIVPPPADVK
jgi:hypothetical protein